MSLRARPGPGPAGFIEPALPSARSLPPSGSGWVHEIKFDGFRLLARREGPRVRLFTRRGYRSSRQEMAAPRSGSCLIKG